MVILGCVGSLAIPVKDKDNYRDNEEINQLQSNYWGCS